MKDRSPLSLLIRGFVLVALIDLAVIAIVAMLGWWSGWIYLEDFQRAINLAGILVIAGGFVGLLVKLRQNHLPANGSDYREPAGATAGQNKSISCLSSIWQVPVLHICYGNTSKLKYYGIDNTVLYIV
ncbi:MAG: hypothetical protein P8Y37_09085 [Anaerolineales bacterium]